MKGGKSGKLAEVLEGICCHIRHENSDPTFLWELEYIWGNDLN